MLSAHVASRLDLEPCPHREDSATQGLGETEGSNSSPISGNRWPSPKSIVLALSVMLWVGSGMLVLCVFEGLHILSAIYVLVQMITTIGYGDLAVQSSDGTKMFLSFYVLFCCVVVGGVIMSAVAEGIEAAREGVASHMDGLKQDAPTEKSKKHVVTSFTLSLLMVLVVLSVGTVFFAFYEKCTCSYSESTADGCDPENCEATGGYIKSAVDAWYMSCVTLTTIGFGDVAPKSLGGRIFSLVWMLGGVASMMNFVVQFTNRFIAASRISKRLELDINELFNKIDLDGNGTLDRFEFVTFAMMELGILDEEDLDAINAQFDDFDCDGSGSVTKDEICERYGMVRQAQAEKFNKQMMNRATATMGLTSKLRPVPSQNVAPKLMQSDLPAIDEELDQADTLDSAGVVLSHDSFEAAEFEEYVGQWDAENRIVESDGTILNPRLDLKIGTPPRGSLVNLILKRGLHDVAVQVTPGELQVDMPAALVQVTPDELQVDMPAALVIDQRPPSCGCLDPRVC